MRHRRLLSRSLVTALAISFFLSACSTTPTPQPITNLNQRLEFGKFSILPPQGDNWFKVASRRSGNSLIYLFARQVEPSQPLGLKKAQLHSIRGRIQASDKRFPSVTNQDEFLGAVKRLERENTSSRFTILEETYNLHETTREYCVVLDKLSEDRGVPSDPGTLYFFHYKALYCYDDQSGLMVVAGCSQRAPRREDMIDLQGECNPFIESLRFH